MVYCVEIYGEKAMKTQQNFLGSDFQKKFSKVALKLKNFFQDRNQKDFPQSFAEGAVKNFTAGVGSLAKKAKEVEEDARRRFCDYPSS